MLPPAFSDVPDSIEAREFEQHIQEGIIAVKNGNLSLARKILEQAALVNSADARIWIWMSATTDDLTERRSYLERAVALDPSNATAKRGLLMIDEKINQSQVMPEGSSYTPTEEAAPEEAIIKTYLCPNCGASISYDIHETTLVCQFCGFTGKVDQHVIDGSSDQVLDATLPTERAHRWAESQSRITCEQCGAILILPAGQTADSCPYCASNRFITSQSLMELVDPQVIGLFKVDPQKASLGIKEWLGKGLLAPDDLALRHAGMQLHPAYYPFWVFEGTLEVPWFFDANVGTSRLPVWETRSGSHFENFKGAIVPGLRKLTLEDIAGIAPFNLEDLVEFSPDFLAGWIALTYDHPLADASLRAREMVLKKAQRTLASEVEPNHTKRNFGTGAGKWSGLTYKLALLPLYIGNYPFQGKRYRVFVNGQTGKVNGKKPQDNVKIVMLSAVGLVLLIIFMVVLFFLIR
jgi:DNA-directed RNA polymerase subunit RPC12/RpoP